MSRELRSKPECLQFLHAFGQTWIEIQLFKELDKVHKSTVYFMRFMLKQMDFLADI